MAPAAGRRASHSSPTSSRLAPPHNAAARSLEVSLRYILQHLPLQRQLRHQALQPGVLFLQGLQSFGLLHLQTSLLVLSTPRKLSLDRHHGEDAGLCKKEALGRRWRLGFLSRWPDRNRVLPICFEFPKMLDKPADPAAMRSVASAGSAPGSVTRCGGSSTLMPGWSTKTITVGKDETLHD